MFMDRVKNKSKMKEWIPRLLTGKVFVDCSEAYLEEEK